MAFGDHILVRRAAGLYSHHGIDCGNETVIHYAPSTRLGQHRVQRCETEQFVRGGTLEVVDYERLNDVLQRGIAGTAHMELQRLLDSFRGLAGSRRELDLSPQAVVDRAESRLGEARFHIVFHNCEHFATWCKTGISDSRQVNRLWRMMLTGPEFQRRRLHRFVSAAMDSPWNPFAG